MSGKAGDFRLGRIGWNLAEGVRGTEEAHHKGPMWFSSFTRGEVPWSLCLGVARSLRRDFSHWRHSSPCPSICHWAFQQHSWSHAESCRCAAVRRPSVSCAKRPENRRGMWRLPCQTHHVAAATGPHCCHPNLSSIALPNYFPPITKLQSLVIDSLFPLARLLFGAGPVCSLGAILLAL